MTWHLAAFSGTLQAPLALAQVPAVADQLLRVQNNNYVMRFNADIPFIHAMGVAMIRARAVSPSWRGITLPEIRPYDTTLTPSDDPNIADLRNRPLQVAATEELEIQVSEGGVALDRTTVLVALQSARRSGVRSGRVYTLRGASTTAAVAGAWTIINVAFDDDLPNGLWEVVGLSVQSANAIAARLIFDNQPERPGFPSITALGNRPWSANHDGSMGVLGSFQAWALPQVEVFANAADAAHEVYLDVMRAG